MWRSPWSFSPPCVLCTKILDLALSLGLTQLLHPGSEKEHQLSSSLLSTPTSRCLCSSPAASFCPTRNLWFQMPAQIPQSKVTFISISFLTVMLATHWLLSAPVVRELFIYLDTLTGTVFLQNKASVKGLNQQWVKECYLSP